jgi:N-acetylmuramic acid 6-phosphate etherase
MRTETVDPRFVDVDSWPTVSAVEAMLEGQLAAIAAIQGQTGAIAAAADAGALRLKAGGRLIYAGAGTSGRIAVQDGVELYPTYDWPRDRLIFLMAGGLGALIESEEGAEDDAYAAQAAIAEHQVGSNDVLIGVAASGRAPFTVAAVQAARKAGALTIGVANNPSSALLTAAEHGVLADTGSEIVAGSTRMKAGTAQKAILNMLSTAMMLRCGLVYRGLMVNMRISNEKLLDRGRRMVADIAGVDAGKAAMVLEAAGNDIKAAVLIALGVAPAAVQALLAEGDLRSAMAARRTGEKPNA